jgi:hypothetical protein
MTYEITVPHGLTLPDDLELIHDNPQSAKEALLELQTYFPNAQFPILRDGTQLGSNELDADIESYEIGLTREGSCQLPTTYRRGWSNTTDEIAKGPDGNPTKVWDPENPEDRFYQPGGLKRKE